MLTKIDALWRGTTFVLALTGSIIFGAVSEQGKTGLWQVFYWYSALLIITTAVTSEPASFFNGKSVGKTVSDQIRKAIYRDAKQPPSAERPGKVGFWTLMPSAFITWIFAKSINNSAVLGGYYGVLGGFAYAAWYVSFWTAGAVGYWLRTRHGYRSLTTAVDKLYGPTAGLCFGLALLYRLFSEVWSNTAVVAGFYGKGPGKDVTINGKMYDNYMGEDAWWWAVVLSTGVPLTYVMLGGMRSSLFSDVVQAAMAIIFLFVVLGVIGHEMGSLSELWAWEPPLGNNVTYQPASGGWLDGGGTLLGAGLVQGLFSYPFMDPVLMDRAFLSTPRTMLHSFAWGGFISMTFIVLFSAIGIYGCVLSDAVKKGSPTNVASSLGGSAEVLIMLVMMTSSLSTLDSTFTATGKLFALEFGGWLLLPGDGRARRGPLRPTDEDHIGKRHVSVARLFMLLMGVVGVLYLLAESDVLKATTVSGTMVMGLGPPIFLALVWQHGSADGAGGGGWRQSPLAFLFSFFTGVTWGSLYQAEGRNPGTYPAVSDLALGEGSYAKLLGVNVYGLLCCAAACAVGFGLDQLVISRTPFATARTVREPDTEHPVTGESVPSSAAAATELKSGPQGASAPTSATQA